LVAIYLNPSLLASITISLVMPIPNRYVA